MSLDEEINKSASEFVKALAEACKDEINKLEPEDKMILLVKIISTLNNPNA
jgi:hypothetical protein